MTPPPGIDKTATSPSNRQASTFRIRPFVRRTLSADAAAGVRRVSTATPTIVSRTSVLSFFDERVIDPDAQFADVPATGG